MNLVKIAKEMRGELEAFFPTIVKGPAPDPQYEGHGVRMVQEQNCDWYREFCDLYMDNRTNKQRRQRTKIKRQHTIAALKRIEEGCTDSIYAQRLIDFMKQKEDKSETEDNFPVLGIPF